VSAAGDDGASAVWAAAGHERRRDRLRFVRNLAGG
jgi:hypothetical protein